MIGKRDNFIVSSRIFIVFILLVVSLNFFSALSLTPAITPVDFSPNFEQTFDYSVSNTNPDTNYLIYIAGDLAQYASLNKEELRGDGGFKVFLSLPSSLETPGSHVLYVGVKELPDKEVVGTVSTAIELIASIKVFVPYPGKYVELSVSSEDANVGEPVKFVINLINRGVETVTAYPRIEISSEQSEEIKETLFFQERILESTEKISLYKNLETLSYNPGRYRGIAIVDFGGESPTTAETFFRIGNLAIDIKNYTSKIILDGKIQKFNINIESGWNDKIDGVYANVSFFNETSGVLSFETSSTNLNPWEVKMITGYFDTLNFQEGVYDANITLFYYGKDVGKSSSKIVQVEFVEGASPVSMIALISLGIIILIGLIIFFLRKKIFRKNEKRK